MSWINRVRKVIPFIAKKETTGDNLWHKCGNCGQMIFLKEWQDNLSVCPKCDHHGRIGPKARFKHIFDEGSCNRSEEHTSELQSLMRNSYAVFCLKKKNTPHIIRPMQTDIHTAQQQLLLIQDLH